MQIQKPGEPSSAFYQTQHLQDNEVVTNQSSDLLSRTLSSDFGDYIGMESCVDMKLDHHDDHQINNRSSRNQRRGRDHKKKECPPPIRSIVRTENLASHMPWILKRHYTSDGRLILTEEKVRHHEYLRVHRSNGRLTLQLVLMDGFTPRFDDHDHDRYRDRDQDQKDKDNDGDHTLKIISKEEEDEEEEVIEEIFSNDELIEESISGNINSNIRNSEGNKGLDYSSHVRTGSPCLFGVPLPTIRPVIS